MAAHTSKSSRQTFIVNVPKNAWACHSDSCVAARGGRIGGNVPDFVSAMENCSVRDAAIKLQDLFIVMPPLPPAASSAAEAAATVRPGIGYNRGTGSMAGRIVIPIHDEMVF